MQWISEILEINIFLKFFNSLWSKMYKEDLRDKIVSRSREVAQHQSPILPPLSTKFIQRNSNPLLKYYLTQKKETEGLKYGVSYCKN